MSATIVYGSKCCFNSGALPASLFSDGLVAILNRDLLLIVGERSVDHICGGFILFYASSATGILPITKPIEGASVKAVWQKLLLPLTAPLSQRIARLVRQPRFYAMK
jgi:hypothetical protein